jgi:hypothetical protein
MCFSRHFLLPDRKTIDKLRALHHLHSAHFAFLLFGASITI